MQYLLLMALELPNKKKTTTNNHVRWSHGNQGYTATVLLQTKGSRKSDGMGETSTLLKLSGSLVNWPSSITSVDGTGLFTLERVLFTYRDVRSMLLYSSLYVWSIGHFFVFFSKWSN